MKKIECVIRPEKLKELIEELRFCGLNGVTVSEAKGFGRETIRPDNFLFLPKTKLEFYVRDEETETIIATIVKCCKEDMLGSGKIAVLPLEECVRVRTEERGVKAIV